MIAVATTALFSIIAVVVGLALIDSFMKLYNAAKAIQRSAQADRLANVSEHAAVKASSGVVTAGRVAPSAPSPATRRTVKQHAAPRFKAPAARHVAA
jgi:hypothetical protein